MHAHMAGGGSESSDAGAKRKHEAIGKTEHELKGWKLRRLVSHAGQVGVGKDEL